MTDARLCVQCREDRHEDCVEWAWWRDETRPAWPLPGQYRKTPCECPCREERLW